MIGEIVLARSCQFCGGDGLVEVFGDQQIEAIRSRDKCGPLTAAEIAKDEPEGTAIECGECEGKGGFLTDAGADMLSFMKQFGDK
jgi:hypothetical protein